MALRKAPPELKFAKFINPRKSADVRATVLLRLDPALLECLDARAAKERLNRHALIIELLEIALKGK